MLIGVNPDPARWDGVLLPFQAKDLKTIIPEVLKGQRQIKEVTMAKAAMNDGQSIYAVNNLFIGQRTHVSSRYLIKSGNQQEFQSSSGVIVSTGLGSTGWLKSVLTGAAKITNAAHNSNDAPFGWNSDYLYFTVREPFPSRTSKTDIVCGIVSNNNPLRLQSQMPENGVIFSDGVESDYLQFNSGLEAVITVAEKKGHLII